MEQLKRERAIEAERAGTKRANLWLFCIFAAVGSIVLFFCWPSVGLFCLVLTIAFFIIAKSYDALTRD